MGPYEDVAAIMRSDGLVDVLEVIESAESVVKVGDLGEELVWTECLHGLNC